MSKSAQIRARMEPGVKEEAEAVLEGLGLSPTAAITMFYKQIIHQQALPFAVALPNALTREAIRDAREGKDLRGGQSVDDLIEALDSTE